MFTMTIFDLLSFIIYHPFNTKNTGVGENNWYGFQLPTRLFFAHAPYEKGTILELVLIVFGFGIRIDFFTKGISNGKK